MKNIKAGVFNMCASLAALALATVPAKAAGEIGAPPDFTSTFTGTQSFVGTAVTTYGPYVVGIALAPLAFKWVYRKITGAMSKG
jgi:hypothetical protein